MDSVVSLITGEGLSPEMRVWSALLPTLLVSAYFIVGMIIWSIKCALFGVEKDQETLKRGSTKIMGFYLRHYYFWLTRPIWGFFYKMRVPPTCVTTLSGLIGAASGIAAAAGRFSLAGWLFIFSGMLDTFDGRLARSRGLSTTWGAAIDSTLDRYADFALLMGMAWYYRADGWPLVTCLFMMMGVALVPYIRARGEALGVKVTGGLMQRPERTMYLGSALALSPVFNAIFWPDEPVHSPHRVAAVMLVIVTLITNWTALTRLYTLVDALKHGRDATAKTEEEKKSDAAERSTVRKMGLNIAAAVIATGVDFAVVMALVHSIPWFRNSEGFATAVGCVAGGIVNFILNRIVTFRSKDAVAPQALRYFGVSLCSMLWNSLGVSLCLSLARSVGVETGKGTIALTVAWWCVRGLVFLLWNYPFQSMYVFGDGEKMAKAVAEEEAAKAAAAAQAASSEKSSA